MHALLSWCSLSPVHLTMKLFLQMSNLNCDTYRYVFIYVLNVCFKEFLNVYLLFINTITMKSKTTFRALRDIYFLNDCK